jgi:hypothetical protein
MAASSRRSRSRFRHPLKRDGTLEGMPVPEGAGDALSARLSGERAARDHRMPAVQSAAAFSRNGNISRRVHGTKSERARLRSHMSKSKR